MGYSGVQEREREKENKSNPFYLIKPAVRQVWAIKNHCLITRTFRKIESLALSIYTSWRESSEAKKT